MLAAALQPLQRRKNFDQFHVRTDMLAISFIFVCSSGQLAFTVVVSALPSATVSLTYALAISPKMFAAQTRDHWRQLAAASVRSLKAALAISLPQHSHASLSTTAANADLSCGKNRP